ncbi:MAG TPA: site-2 protease family protein [Candidatus Limnocylindria bacterium]|nr:site-2 protease family protein [Candidatus Limnocylindria bacterium]
MIFGNTDPATLLAIVVALVVGITFHEFSHALVAEALGDHRPRALGRLSLNPAAHIDPLGALFLVLVGFGWGKPVPVNPSALRPGRQGLSWVSAAGPVANLVVAVVFAMILRAVELIGVDSIFIVELLSFVVLYNVALAIFNLLPIPPLDGWNFTLGLVPLRTAFTLQQYQGYGMIALLVLVLLSYGSPGGGPIGWIFGLANLATTVLTGEQRFGL